MCTQCVLTYITVLLLLSLQDLLLKLTLPSAVPTFILRDSIERSIHFQHACGRTACVLTPVPLTVDLLLQDLLSKLALPGAVLTSIQKSFAPGSLLIARSSANVEDLAGTSLQRPHLSTGQHVTHNMLDSCQHALQYSTDSGTRALCHTGASVSGRLF